MTPSSNWRGSMSRRGPLNVWPALAALGVALPLLLLALAGQARAEPTTHHVKYVYILAGIKLTHSKDCPIIVSTITAPFYRIRPCLDAAKAVKARPTTLQVFCFKEPINVGGDHLIDSNAPPVTAP